jgi:rfaE bifunctional protein nucleotidyltransferase chain/domain
MTPSSKLLPLPELIPRVEKLKSVGKRIVLTNGVFDLLHPGHVRFLRQAKALGEVLIIGVNGDASARRLKGPSRPWMNAADRAELIAALESVDYVVIFEEDTAEALVNSLKPHLYVKGGDYTIERLPEAASVEHIGAKVVILPLSEGYSTSGLIERIAQQLRKS